MNPGWLGEKRKRYLCAMLTPKQKGNLIEEIGGAVAEWSKALLVTEHKVKPKDPRTCPGLSNL